MNHSDCSAWSAHLIWFRGSLPTGLLTIRSGFVEVSPLVSWSVTLGVGQNIGVVDCTLACDQDKYRKPVSAILFSSHCLQQKVPKYQQVLRSQVSTHHSKSMFLPFQMFWIFWPLFLQHVEPARKKPDKSILFCKMLCVHYYYICRDTGKILVAPQFKPE